MGSERGLGTVRAPDQKGTGLEAPRRMRRAAGDRGRSTGWALGERGRVAGGRAGLLWDTVSACVAAPEQTPPCSGCAASQARGQKSGPAGLPQLHHGRSPRPTGEGWGGRGFCRSARVPGPDHPGCRWQLDPEADRPQHGAPPRPDSHPGPQI